jgi:hypothetical protein
VNAALPRCGRFGYDIQCRSIQLAFQSIECLCPRPLPCVRHRFSGVYVAHSEIDSLRTRPTDIISNLQLIITQSKRLGRSAWQFACATRNDWGSSEGGEPKLFCCQFAPVMALFQQLRRVVELRTLAGSRSEVGTWEGGGATGGTKYTKAVRG